MTDQNTTEAAGPESPVFRLQKMYVKDLSFENPNAPEVFFVQQAEPKVDFKLGIKNRKMDEENWEVTMAITATITDTKSSKTYFIMEIEHAAIFLLKNIPEQHLAGVLNVECPTLMFPFTRQIVSQMSVDGGFIPFLMEPVNFLALYQGSLAQQQKKAEN